MVLLNNFLIFHMANKFNLNVLSKRYPVQNSLNQDKKRKIFKVKRIVTFKALKLNPVTGFYWRLERNETMFYSSF